MYILKNIKNSLFHGENLSVLKQIPSESVDLVYIDPPFFTGLTQKNDSAGTTKFRYQDSSSYFESQNGSDAKGMAAYLEWLETRVIELRRILKPTGSIYLHVDYHASHYTKILMDRVFGTKHFVNEIIWQRKFSCTHTNKAPRSFQNNHDTIFLYAKSKQYTFNPQHRPYDPDYVKQFNLIDDQGEHYMSVNLTSPTYRQNLVYKYKGFSPTEKGWSVSIDKMRELDAAGLLIFPKNKDGRIRRKSYLKDKLGFPINNIWTDIGCVQGQSSEKTNWPTQKPASLLQRIIETSSMPGQTVLDCFSGSGTTIAVAHTLKRNWIGIEQSAAAVKITRDRFRQLGEKVNVVRAEISNPVDERFPLQGAA